MWSDVWSLNSFLPLHIMLNFNESIIVDNMIFPSSQYQPYNLQRAVYHNTQKFIAKYFTFTLDQLLFL